MDERNIAKVLVLLLCVIAGMLAEGHTQDVCATCHSNAICDDKSDGSGKVCNCKYGFVGNGRTFCQDKDECQIGASKICGQHTNCHNTYGSYYCTCLAGYSPSNKMTTFIPNDGTHCQDIDECRIAGLCGEGGQCRNLDGSFECSCQLGYKVHSGVDPFHPYRDKASCKVVDCGQPASVEDMVLLSVSGSTYSSVAMFGCDEGFVWRSGDNSSVCGADGLWTGLTMVCEAKCGPVPFIANSVVVWHDRSIVIHRCLDGYYSLRGSNVSVCGSSGLWQKATLRCIAKCGPVPFIANSVVVWHNRSTVIHRCLDGYYSRRGSNVSVCGSSGLWQKATLRCIAKCGPVPFIANSVVVWHNRSIVIHRCLDGYHSWRGSNVSVCGSSGLWQKATLKCIAKCGPVPLIANSVVVWHNRSIVIHRCLDGYHSWRGSNVSVCGSSGLWQKATLRCIEIKPPISHLFVLNEKCLHWKAEKYEEDTEVYKVTYIGSRDFQKSFHDKRKCFLSSKAHQLELCLNLLPVTNYSISITAVSTRFTATITTNTSLPVPPAPVVYYREFETPVPTLGLRRSPNPLDPISLYQVFVLPVEGIMMFDCSSPASSNPTSKLSLTEYITAQIDVRHVGTEMNFTVGDALYYGGFFNAPLENGRNYYIILRAVNQWKMVLKSSCVLWAKVRGTSYVLRVSSLSAAAFIGLVALIILVGYSFIWIFKKT